MEIGRRTLLAPHLEYLEGQLHRSDDGQWDFCPQVFTSMIAFLLRISNWADTESCHLNLDASGECSVIELDSRVVVV